MSPIAAAAERRVPVGGAFGRWLPLGAAVAGGVALGPLLLDIVGRLWDSPRFGHAPLVWAAAAGVGWFRLREDREQRRLERAATGAAVESPGPRPVPEVLLWAPCLLASFGAVWLATPWLALVAAFLSAPAAIYSLGGSAALRPVLGAWAAVWTTLPPPFQWDERLVLRLQRVAADLASAALDLLGRRHLPAGVTVELPGRSYFVEEACSGVNSLYALLAVTALGLAWAGRGWPRWLILLPAAILWAVAANAVRVTAAVELSAGYGWPVAEGLGHDLLGLFTFVLAAGLTWSSDALLALIVPPRAARPGRGEEEEEESGDGAVPPARFAPPRPAVWGAIAVLLLAAAGWRLAEPAPARPVAAVGEVPDTLKPTSEDSLPESWNGWRRVGFRKITRERGHIDGTYSSVWSYRRGPLRAEISMDGPFTDGWHDLQLCYTNGGWTCTDAVDRVLETDDRGTSDRGTSDRGTGPSGEVFTRLDLEQPLGRRGLVFFTSYAMDDDEHLGPDPAARTKLTARFESFRDLLPADPGGGYVREPGYQVQTYVSSYRPLTGGEADAVRALFHEMRGRLAALPRAAEPAEPAAGNRGGRP